MTSTHPQAVRKCFLCQTKAACSWDDVLQAYVCGQCTCPQSYSTANFLRKGQPHKHPSFSLEFEVVYVPYQWQQMSSRAMVLIKYGFKRTSDATVCDEYKSPIFQSVRAFRKPLQVLDTLSDLVDDRCGTHLHVACQYKDLLRAIQPEVFSQLITHLLNHPQETIQFWGRTFGSYVRPNNPDRYHCFNLDSRHPTLEFRLPRFHSAAQYLHVVICARKIVAYLDAACERIEQRESLLQDRALPTVSGLPGPAAMGQHVLRIYRSQVARMQQAGRNTPTPPSEKV